MEYAATTQTEATAKCCVVYDSKDGTIRHIHRIVTLRGADETADDAVVYRTLALSAELGIDPTTVKALRVEERALEPGTRYAVDVEKGSLKVLSKIDPAELLR